MQIVECYNCDVSALHETNRSIARRKRDRFYDIVSIERLEKHLFLISLLNRNVRLELSLSLSET